MRKRGIGWGNPTTGAAVECSPEPDAGGADV